MDQPENETTSEAVLVREPAPPPPASVSPTPAPTPGVDAQQARVEAVANLTFHAYEKASTLKLSPEEIKALQADFPDDAFKPGAAGKENLIYIEHAFLRDRLNEVIGVGQWALIPRNRWAEDYSFTNKYRQIVQAARVYVEAMLVVRGIYVAEAVGEMEYYKNNAGQNYADAVEGAKTAALRRCCKEFGVGLQAWKKDFCIAWWERKNKPRPRPAPARPSAPTPMETKPQDKVEGQQEVKVTVKLVSEKDGVTNGKAWKAYFVLLNDGISDLEAGTFSATLAGMARTLEESGEQAEATIKPGTKPGRFELVSLMPLPSQEEDDVPML